LLELIELLYHSLKIAARELSFDRAKLRVGQGA
jgi:hypothetical protein